MRAATVTPEEGATLMLTALEAQASRWKNRANALGTTFSGSADDISYWTRAGAEKRPDVLAPMVPAHMDWEIRTASEKPAWRRTVLAFVAEHANVRVVKRSKSGSILTYRYV